MQREWETIDGILTEVRATDSRITVKTTAGEWAFRTFAECCANAYIHEPETVNAEAAGIVGQRIVSAEVVDGPSSSDYDLPDAVRDVRFYRLRTERDTLTVTLYVDHNGYYGGSLDPVGVW